MKVTSAAGLEAVMMKRLQEIKSRVDKIEGRTVSVGIEPNAKYPDGKSVAEVADIIEHGTATMRPRPFLRVTHAEKMDKWMRTLKAGAFSTMKTGAEIEDVMDQVGQDMEEGVQKTIVEMGAYRTGKMHDSIIHTVS